MSLDVRSPSINFLAINQSSAIFIRALVGEFILFHHTRTVAVHQTFGKRQGKLGFSIRPWVISSVWQLRYCHVHHGERELTPPCRPPTPWRPGSCPQRPRPSLSPAGLRPSRESSPHSRFGERRMPASYSCAKKEKKKDVKRVKRKHDEDHSSSTVIIFSRNIFLVTIILALLSHTRS